MTHFILKIIFTVIVVSLLYVVYLSYHSIVDLANSVRVCSTEVLSSNMSKLTCNISGYKFAEINKMELLVEYINSGYSINDYYKKDENTVVYILNKK